MTNWENSYCKSIKT